MTLDDFRMRSDLLQIEQARCRKLLDGDAEHAASRGSGTLTPSQQAQAMADLASALQREIDLTQAFLDTNPGGMFEFPPPPPPAKKPEQEPT